MYQFIIVNRQFQDRIRPSRDLLRKGAGKGGESLILFWRWEERVKEES